MKLPGPKRENQTVGCSASRAVPALSLLILLLAVLHSAPLLAEDDLQAAAKELFLVGRTDFAAGNYEKALSSFEAANKLVPSFVLQFNIGRCLEEALRLHEALAAFELVIRHGDDPELEAKARAQVKGIKARASRSGVRVLNHRLGIRVIIDGSAVTLDPTGFVAVIPGTRRVEIWQPFHRPHLHYVVVSPEQVKDITLALLPPERLRGAVGDAGSEGLVSKEPSFLRRNWPALSTIGLGLAGLGVGVTLRVLGQAEWDAISGAARDDDGRIVGMSERTAESRGAKADRYELASYVSFGVAGLSFLTSAVLLALDGPGDDTSPPRRATRPKLQLAPGGVSLRWTW